MSDDSRAILLTPPGTSALAVVRLTGARVDAFVRAHVSREVPAGRCVHANLVDGDAVIDDPVVVRCADDTVDLSLHGGPWVVQAALNLAERFGFAISSPGFPLDPAAVDAETPRQREVLRYLPWARTELAIRELLAQEKLWAEFDASSSDDRRRLAPGVLNDRSLYWLLNPPRVALVGVPNAGKSTLANQLFAQERSITADVPGTTRDWIGEQANVDGLVVTLMDTPGLRRSDDPIEQAAIARAAPEIAAADLVLLVLNAARPLSEQEDILTRFPHAPRLVNKADVATWPAAAVGGTRLVAASGEGVDEVRRLITTHFQITARPGRQKWWTPEQRERLASECGREPRPPGGR